MGQLLLHTARNAGPWTMISWFGKAPSDLDSGFLLMRIGACRDAERDRFLAQSWVLRSPSREINSETSKRNLPKMPGICAIRNVMATEVGAGAWWLALQRSSQVDVAEPVLDSKTLDANRGSYRF